MTTANVTTLNVSGVTTLSGALNSTANIITSGSFSTNNGTISCGQLAANTTFGGTGNGIFQGTVSAANFTSPTATITSVNAGVLAVSSTATLNGALNVTGATSLSSLNVSGTTTVATLSTGAASIGGALTATSINTNGLVDFNYYVNANHGLKIQESGFPAYNSLTASGTLTAIQSVFYTQGMLHGRLQMGGAVSSTYVYTGVVTHNIGTLDYDVFLTGQTTETNITLFMACSVDSKTTTSFRVVMAPAHQQSAQNFFPQINMVSASTNFYVSYLIMK
jgi:hypothetical protein